MRGCQAVSKCWSLSFNLTLSRWRILVNSSSHILDDGVHSSIMSGCVFFFLPSFEIKHCCALFKFLKDSETPKMTSKGSDFIVTPKTLDIISKTPDQKESILGHGASLCRWVAVEYLQLSHIGDTSGYIFWLLINTYTRSQHLRVGGINDVRPHMKRSNKGKTLTEHPWGAGSPTSSSASGQSGCKCGPAPTADCPSPRHLSASSTGGGKHGLHAVLTDFSRTSMTQKFRVSFHLIVEDLQVPEGGSAELHPLWGAGQTLEWANWEKKKIERWLRRCQEIMQRRTRNANTHKMFGKKHFGELEALTQTHLHCQTNGSDHEKGVREWRAGGLCVNWGARFPPSIYLSLRRTLSKLNSWR